MLNITHNDESIQIPAEMNITQFLTFKEVKHPKYAVVELNGTILNQDEWDKTIIKNGDDIEHAYLMGGG